MKKKKIGVMLGIGVILTGMTFATISSEKILENFVESGTVQVKSIDLQLKDSEGNLKKGLENWDPGDVNLLTWKVKNIGTAAVYTKNVLQIYWNDDKPNENKYLYLYPANISKEDIIEDIKKEKESQYIIKPEDVITLSNGEQKIGIEYTFLGDSLDGSQMTGNSYEVDYNIEKFEKTTDDNSDTEDTIGFNIVLSPNTPYLYANKSITIKVVTMAMQHTKEGQEEWKIVDEQTL